MPQGTVKWFSDDKGYGFILTDEGAEELERVELTHDHADSQDHWSPGQ